MDLIRKQRDGIELNDEEIKFLVRGAAEESLPMEQLSAWLMAAWLRGLSHNELTSLTQAMRFSGEVFDTTTLGKLAVDKHSTGGVGDKTSFLVAPIAAAAGLAVPMISGRALGHTGGTLDKIESIPGYRTKLSLAEFRSILDRTGASIMGQTKNLAPADRVLYALRDRTATVESPDLICASIMSKKLAEGLHALVLDVKTGSGAFLQREQDALHLASLMVQTGEAAGTRTVALLTGMEQPLGRAAGNWIEVAEAIELLHGGRDPLTEDLRELSIALAGWMIYLGEEAASPDDGRRLAEELLDSGAAFHAFRAMVEAQGGDPGCIDHPSTFHKPGASRNFPATRSGIISEMDCAQVGWAVQRLGAGRERVGDAVDPHAGLLFHAKCGSTVEAGQAICTMFAASEDKFEEPERLLRTAIHIQDTGHKANPPVRRIITVENAAQFLKIQ
ncbi:MAG TPA: thymidine phosphorylase [Acidisarcina sp.]|nr:thymidine phosphorylase [Acidisarcina sp.]